MNDHDAPEDELLPICSRFGTLLRDPQQLTGSRAGRLTAGRSSWAERGIRGPFTAVFQAQLPQRSSEAGNRRHRRLIRDRTVRSPLGQRSVLDIGPQRWRRGDPDRGGTGDGVMATPAHGAMVTGFSVDRGFSVECRALRPRTRLPTPQCTTNLPRCCSSVTCRRLRRRSAPLRLRGEGRPGSTSCVTAEPAPTFRPRRARH